MPKQAFRVCISLFIVLSLLANYSFSAETSGQSYAPVASETKTKYLSPGSLPVLPKPDSPSTESEAETLAPTSLSVSPNANIPDVETKSNETLVDQENASILSKSDEPSSLQSKGEENLPDQELLASSPSVNDPTSTPEITNKRDENVSTTSPSNVDNSVLDTRDMDNNMSQENNTSVRLSKAADPPAVETKETSEDVFQENTSLPPSPSVDAPPAVETKNDENVSQEKLPSPDESKDNENLPEEIASVPSYSSADMHAPAPSYTETTPVLDTSDDGSFTQENQYSPVTSVNAPAPETKGEEEITTQENYPSATPPNAESQNPENVPELNDYRSLPKSAVPSPSEAISSYPESNPTFKMTPSNSNDETFGSAPTSHSSILPFNYRAEDEPVEPYEEEEDSENGVNGAVAGVLVSAFVVGAGCFVYQKRKNDSIRAQYTCLAKKGGV